MTVGEDSVQYRKRKKHCFLAAAILLFIGKINITKWPPWVVWKLFFLIYHKMRLTIVQSCSGWR